MYIDQYPGSKRKVKKALRLMDDLENIGLLKDLTNSEIKTRIKCELSTALFVVKGTMNGTESGAFERAVKREREKELK